MAKKLLTPVRGKLTGLLRERGLTQADLQTKSRIDLKTVRKIARGEAVKEVTLKSVADALRIPISHLLEGEVLSADIIPIESRVAGERAKTKSVLPPPDEDQVFPLGRASPALLSANLIGARKVIWRLQIRALPEAAVKLLEKFEKLVEQWHTKLNAREKHDSLSHQLEVVRTYDEVEKIISELRSVGIGVFVATHLFWSRDETEDYYEVRTLEFVSEARAVIALHASSDAILRITYRELALQSGEPPPRTYEDFEAVRIRVNWRLVWDPTSYGDQLEDGSTGEDIPF